MGQSRTDHDRLFKELLSTFFEEFMLLFFPEAYEQIDFQKVDFLSQEFFTDVTEGDKHLVDLLVQTKLKGEDSIILIHVEAQAEHQRDFNRRMFTYFSRIYQKHQRNILPIAVFSFDTPRDEPNAFTIQFPFAEVLQFQYLAVELKKKNWRDFIKQENPVAAALLSKMGYNENEKVEIKKEFLRIMVKLGLDRARESLLNGFFETYLDLTEEEEEQLIERVRALPKEEAKEVMEYMTSYERRGIEKGIVQVAKRMLARGKNVDEIMDLTGLSKSEVDRLKAEVTGDQ